MPFEIVRIICRIRSRAMECSIKGSLNLLNNPHRAWFSCENAIIKLTDVFLHDKETNCRYTRSKHFCRRCVLCAHFPQSLLAQPSEFSNLLLLLAVTACAVFPQIGRSAIHKYERNFCWRIKFYNAQHRPARERERESTKKIM
jgi:hypothetical protein